MAFTSNTLPSPTELAKILDHISPNVPYDTWFKIATACGRAYNQDPAIFAIVQNWSKGYANHTAKDESLERTSFFVSSKRHDGVGIGWLINEAKRGGYEPTFQGHETPSIVYGELKTAPKSMIANALNETMRSDSATSEERVQANSLLKTVNAVLNFWVFESASFAVDRVKFLKDNFSVFTSLVPPPTSLYFNALSSYCDFLKDPVLFNEVKFMEWGLRHVYGFDAGELNALCSEVVGATSDIIETPVEAIDKFNAAMKSASVMLAGYTSKRITELCSGFDRASNKRVAEDEILKEINKLSIAMALGSSSLTNVLGRDVARISKECALTALNPETAKNVYVKTGMPVLDSYIKGYRRGATTILAAHSGVGKTWYGVDAARNVLEQGGRVLFCSSEMAAEEICQRFTNNIRNVDDETLQGLYERERMGLNEPSNNNTFSKVFFDVNCFFDEHPNLSIIAGKTGGLSVEQITQEIAVQSQSGELDLVVIDYLQNLDNDSFNPRAANWERIKDTMEQINNASRVYNCPILILAQLNNPNRKPSGAAAEPNMYDVAEASAVVRDAAAVLLLYKVKMDEAQQAASITGSALRMIVGKSRFGNQTSHPLEMMRDKGSRFTAFE